MIDGAAANKGKVNLDSEWERDVNDPSIYHYGGDLSIRLWHMAKSAKVYVAVADREIRSIKLPSDPNEIVSLKYDPSIEGAASSVFMKNLYATPYNLNKSDGAYYGTVIDLNTNTPSVNVMLYHVAARLDIKWNVAEERRKTFALGALSVSNLPKKCYLFRPTENALPDNAGDAYSEPVVSSFSPTTAWSGRRAVYVPQVNNRAAEFPEFPVTLSFTNAVDAVADTHTERFAFAFKNKIYTTWFNVEADFVDSN
jgi:hypothetical protein